MNSADRLHETSEDELYEQAMERIREIIAMGTGLSLIHICGVTSLGGDYTYNHIYSTNLGEPLPTPHGKYTHAKDRHVGNLWLRHVKQWERFDVSGSAGVSFTPYGTSALWSLSGGYRPVRGLRLEVGAAQSMRLPTFTDLYYCLLYTSVPSMRPPLPSVHWYSKPG